MHKPILDWIESQKEIIVDDIMKWSSINSHVFNPEGQRKQREAIIQKLKPLNCQIEEITLPSFVHMDDSAAIHRIEVEQALVASKRADAPVQVLLSGHLDTVFPKHSIFQEASMTSETMLQGPGVSDMKGGIRVALLVLEAFEKTLGASSVGWTLVINPDEEIGSPSSESLLTQLAKKADYALVFEPAFPDGAFVDRRAGSLNLAIVARGVAAHAGRDFAKGRSALIALATLVANIQALPKLEAITINVGAFHSGHAYNIVPDLAVCKVNIRADTTEHLTQAYHTVNKLVETHRHLEGILFSVTEISKRLPMESVDSTLLGKLTSCAHALGIEVTTRLSRGVSDANIFSQAGVRTLDTLGPIGCNLHTEQEAVFVPSLIERAKLGFLLMTKLIV